MNEIAEGVPTSGLARASRRLGVLSLTLLPLGGCTLVVVAAFGASSHRGGPTREQLFASTVGEAICQGAAGVASLAALVTGTFALIGIRRSAGKIRGKGSVVTGLVTATLTALILVLLQGPVIPRLMSVPASMHSSNNLKSLGLAMLDYESAHGCLPPAVLRDPRLGDRAQPYSWRVAVLPILGEPQLFRQYRRDEPWDSPANKEVLARMPSDFALPADSRAAEGFTHYQVLVGPGTVFERPDLKVRSSELRRGAGQTILIVEAAEPVPWTKPEDLSYAPDGRLPKVGGALWDGFQAVFADGSVRWFAADQRESALRTLVPR